MASRRQVAGQKIDTAATVRQAMDMAESKPLDLADAAKKLGWLGNQNPSDEQIERYARDARLLATLDQLVPGMNCRGQPHLTPVSYQLSGT